MDSERRLGWLVLSWRHSSDTSGFPELRQWRAGSWIPTYDDCAAAEEDAQLARGRLTSLIDLLRGPGGPAAPRPPVPISGAMEAFECAIAGRATAAQWWDLGALVRADPTSAPSGQALDALLFALVNALPRGVKHAYRMMRSAALDLAAVPGIQDAMVAAVRDCVRDPDGPSFLETIGLLEQIPTAESRGLILDLMEESRVRPQRQYAAGLATEVLARGDFTEAERSRMVLGVLSSWRSDPVIAHEDLGQLIDVLPPGLAAALARDARKSNAVSAESRDHPSAVESVRWSRDLTNASLSQWPGGGEVMAPMLESLVQECLFVRNAERRWRAALVLGASPFQTGLAHGLTGLLKQTGVPAVLRRRAAAALNHVVVGGSTLQMIPLLHDPDTTVAARVTTAYGHTAYSETSDQVLRRNVPVEQLPTGRARVYALGMTGSPGIAALAESRTAPRWQRHTARWWHETGPAIHA